jgi:hypothetical protein
MKCQTISKGKKNKKKSRDSNTETWKGSETNRQIHTDFSNKLPLQAYGEDGEQETGFTSYKKGSYCRNNNSASEKTALQ